MIYKKLLVGGNQEKRVKNALKIAKEYLNSNFPQNHPDFLLVEGENSIGIERIRELKRQIALKPYLGRFKVVLIHQAEKLTLPAQNALLKTLEEPPPGNLIILTAPQAESLLPTIVSRCQVIKLLGEKKIDSLPVDFSEILKSRVGERLKIVDKFAKNKNQAIEFSEILLFMSRKNLRENPTADEAKKVRKISQTLILLKANVNPNLAVGNLFLSL